MIDRLCNVVSILFFLVVLFVGGLALGLGAPLWALAYVFTGFNFFRFWMDTLDLLVLE